MKCTFHGPIKGKTKRRTFDGHQVLKTMRCTFHGPPRG